MSKKDKKKKSDKKRGGGWIIFLMIITSIAMILTLQMTYVLFVIGVIPSFVAYYIDRTHNRSLFHTVMPCNLSGVLPFIAQLAVGGNQSSQLQSMLGDLSVMLMMYVSAGFGWIVYYASPHLASLIINTINSRQISSLQNSQSRLMSEWGNEVTRVEMDS